MSRDRPPITMHAVGRVLKYVFLGLAGPAVAGALLLMSAPFWILRVLFADAPGAMEATKRQFNIEFSLLIVLAVVVSAATILIFRERPHKSKRKPPPVVG